MSRNFHNVHVYVRGPRERDRIERAVVASAARAGFERVKRASGADRVIRIGGRGAWLTIEDDGYEAEAIARAVAAAVRGPVLEAYCEASAIVWLAMYAGGRRAGGWGDHRARKPPARLVTPVLAKGTAAELAAAWDHGRQQTFPEEALAVAADRFGISVKTMFGDTQLRGTTIALRRKTKAWTARYHRGPPSFHIGYAANQGWGPRHLVFVGDECADNLYVRSTGGPSRGLALRFGGSAIAGGHLEILGVVGRDGTVFERDGDAWRAPRVVMPAGLVDSTVGLALGAREADKARDLEAATERYLEVRYRALRDGVCDLETRLESGSAVATGTHTLAVQRPPWRPRAAREGVSTHALFDMHRREHAIAHVALRGPLADAWAWARPHVERWAASRADPFLRIAVGSEVVFEERRDRWGVEPEVRLRPLPFDRVAEHVPGPTTTFTAGGHMYAFGTFHRAPWHMDPREQLAVQLVLCGFDATGECAELLPALEAICDDAIARGAATSALVYQHRHTPADMTPWEEITVGHDAPLGLAAWHATHVRGIDKRIWLAAELAARVDRTALAQRVTVNDVGTGLRLQMNDDLPRAELEPVAELLGSLVPTQAEVERWRAARAAELGALATAG